MSAMAWVDTLVEHGNAWGQFLKGCLLQSGVEGVLDKDTESSVNLIRLAADQGLAAAQNSLGLCHAKGLSVQQDDEKAVALYRFERCSGSNAEPCPCSFTVASM